MGFAQELCGAERQLQELRRIIGNTNLEISDLRNVDDPTPGDQRMLEDELAVALRKICELEAKVTVTKTAMTDATSDLKDAEVAMTEVEEQIRAVTEQLIPFQESLAHVHSDLQRTQDDLAYYTRKMKEFETKVGELGQRLAAAEKELSETVSKAEQICAEKIKTRRTAENIASEIQQIQAKWFQ